MLRQALLGARRQQPRRLSEASRAAAQPANSFFIFSFLLVLSLSFLAVFYLAILITLSSASFVCLYFIFYLFLSVSSPYVRIGPDGFAGEQLSSMF